jgi:hypothetical protein
LKIGIIGDEELERVKSERVDPKTWKKPVRRTFSRGISHSIGFGGPLQVNQ